MTEIKCNRRVAWIFLSVAIPFLTAFVILAVKESAPWWAYVFMGVTLGFPLSLLLWSAVMDTPAMVIREGYLEQRILGRKPIRIALKNIRSVRIAKPWGAEGRFYFLELALHEMPPELDTKMLRYRKKLAEKYMTYDPPAEPYLMLQIPLLKDGDEELAAAIRSGIAEAA